MTQSREPHEEPDRQEHHHLEHETVQDVRAERALLARAIGGWRGAIDSGLPSAVFVAAFVIAGLVFGTATDDAKSTSLRVSLIAAGAVAVGLALVRLIRRESVVQVIAGLVGVGLSAFFVLRTGSAANAFFPNWLLNASLGLAFLISILVRWPLIGVLVGMLTGEGTTWRGDARLRRPYAAATWLWVGAFFLRVVVVGLLWLAVRAFGDDSLWFVALGITRIVLGYPLYLLAAYATYLVLKGPIASARERKSSTSQPPTT